MVNLSVIIRAIGLLELKFTSVGGFKKTGCSGTSYICLGIANLLLVKCRQGLSSCMKSPHCFVSLRSIIGLSLGWN